MGKFRNGALIATMVIGLVVVVPLGWGKEPYRQALISADRNMNVDPFLFGRDMIVSRYATPDCPTPWSVRKFRYFGGKQEQVYMIWIDNGKLQIGLIPTRGMGILSVLMDGKRVLGWDSPVKDLVHPSLINLNSRGGLGWLEGFNEWLCRCGMEWNGQPGTDRVVNNMGEETTMELTLHGRIANLPAQEVLLIAERDPPYRLTLRGIVHERMFNGPKLELTSELSVEPGARAFRLSDAVTNRGGQRQEFQMLYHTNFGPPLLEEGARFLAPVEVVTPFNDHAAREIKQYDQYPGPKPGSVEQVYNIQPLADRSGRTLVMIRNKAANSAASLRFDTHELPYLTLWKNMAAQEDGYVTGIEPGTNYPNNRRIERQHGRVPSLSPGESHYMTIDFAIHVGTAEVEQVTQEITRIQSDRRPLLKEKPEKKE
jgi:galactose mutarotase-like enzyme